MCPSDPRASRGGVNTVASRGGLTCYLGVTGNSTGGSSQEVNGPTNGIFDVRAYGITMTSITDGTSNTVMIGERPPARDEYWGWWAVSDVDSLLSVRQFYAFYSGCVIPGFFRPEPQLLNAPCGGGNNHFWSFHTNGANWAMADASVRFINYSAGTTSIIAMGSRDQGEIFNEP